MNKRTGLGLGIVGIILWPIGVCILIVLGLNYMVKNHT